MAETSIEWADKVWNPVTGCTKVSAGCKNCYAETIAGRFWAKQYPPNADGTPRKFADVRCHPERLNEPMFWKKPAKVFVDSMSDLFHPDVPFEFIDKVIYNAAKAWCFNKSTFMILTKRPERMLEWESRHGMPVGMPLHGIWMGVSVENKKTADERIPLLLQISAEIRFVSVEPMLEAIDFRVAASEGNKAGWYIDCPICGGTGYRTARSGEHGGFDCKCKMCGGRRRVPGIHWCICGCESGSGARSFNPDWARSLRDQCQAAEVPFFLKQMPIDGKLVKMPELDGKVWADYPKTRADQDWN